MHNDRILDLGEDIRNHVFELLDSEPGLTGEDAGKVASILEKTFITTLQLLLDSEPGFIEDYSKVATRFLPGHNHVAVNY